MRREGLLPGLLVAIFVVAGCTKGPLPGSISVPGSSSSGYGLISAQYAACGQQGTALATYLDTGQPTSDDPTYGNQRQQVLSLSGEQRALYIRQQADSLIESCDQEQAQAAQQQAAAQAGASAQAKANAELQAAQPVCQAVGGTAKWQQTVDAGTILECENIGYIGSDGSTYYASVQMNPSTAQLEGPMSTAGTGATQQECASGYYPNLSTGPGYGKKGTWNGTLQACLPS